MKLYKHRYEFRNGGNNTKDFDNIYHISHEQTTKRKQLSTMGQGSTPPWVSLSKILAPWAAIVVFYAVSVPLETEMHAQNSKTQLFRSLFTTAIPNYSSDWPR